MPESRRSPVAVAGALLGFLLFNVHPASVFMGDTGSLALGGFVVSTAYIMQMPLFIPIVGLIYLVEIIFRHDLVSSFIKRLAVSGFSVWRRSVIILNLAASLRRVWLPYFRLDHSDFVHDFSAARDVALWKEREAGYGADTKKSIGHGFRGKRDCLNGALAEKRSADSSF